MERQEVQGEIVGVNQKPLPFRAGVTLDDDVMTIVASIKMDELPALKKKIEALEALYKAG